jgi:hypothetical protein
MTPKRATVPPAGIATVERDTKLSKHRLSAIRRLMDRGVRPGEVMAEPRQAPNARLQTLHKRLLRTADPTMRPLPPPAAAEALRLLKAHQVDE